MANELKEINDIVKKCKILLLDIEGTTTSISFVKDKLFPYAEQKVKQFLVNQWEKDDVKDAVTALRKLALEDKERSVDGVVTIPGEDSSKEEQIEGLVNSVKWQMSADRKAAPLKQLQGLIWKEGYDSGDIKGHVYDDVSAALEHWQSVEGQKIYIYSSGSVQAQKLLFGQSQAGDLLRFIEGHFDTAVGAKQEVASYSAITESIGCKPDEILFLTDIVKEAEAARAAGLHAALVSREGNEPLPAEASAAFAVLHSLAQLTSNKRKTEPQDELPAKMAKTDKEDDVKTVSEVEPTESAKVTEKSEKMEVEEETVGPIKEVKEPKEADISPVVIDTIVEEVTNMDVPIDVPIVDIQPVVIEEIAEKEKQNDKMETSTEIDESCLSEKNVKNSKENTSKEATPVPEEMPLTVITEIEELTNDNALKDAEEIMDDIEPIVEEPPATEDMEALQNVGDVLEKECDEILSKVQDVTNLATIPVKPLLNPIAEETMETENLDSNDIVDRILDSELELEDKQSKNVEKSTDAKVTDEAKTETKEGKEVPEEVANKASENITEEKLSSKNEANSGKINKETVDKVPESSKIEIKEKESKTAVNEEESKTEETKKSETECTEGSGAVEQKLPAKSSDTDTQAPVAESKDNTADDEVKPDIESKELQVNGKTTNGNSEPVSFNGDASNDEELSSRLSAENGKQEEVNGSNGDSIEKEKGQDEKTVEAEVSDIKVKTVPTEEPRTDPIEQPTKA